MTIEEIKQNISALAKEHDDAGNELDYSPMVAFIPLFGKK